MTALAAAILDQSDGRIGLIAKLIERNGGRVIPRDQNAQPIEALKVASVQIDGITGFGPTLIGAAMDWRNKAQRRTTP